MAFPCVYVANEAAHRGIFLDADCEEGYSGIPWCKKLGRVFVVSESGDGTELTEGSSALLMVVGGFDWSFRPDDVLYGLRGRSSICLVVVP